jgi:c-di-GMP-related signal transduction protein
VVTNQSAVLHHDPITTVFVARQPIFDATKSVIGYELLYRSSQDNFFDHTDGTAATLDVIRNAFLVLGPLLTKGKKAFINFNKVLLENKAARVLNPSTTVIEILEDVDTDENIITLCRELKNAGYSIALDDVDSHIETKKDLIDLTDIVKADFQLMTADERTFLASTYRSRCKCLAEKIETNEEFEEAKKAGYVYFQGYFFGKPIILSANQISGNKITYMKMLAEINRRELDFSGLEKAIKQDPYLSFTLLNYMNSAYFGLPYKIGSIGQALILLGEKEILKWSSLVILTFIGSDKPSEVCLSSLVRAKFCESMAPDVGLQEKASELFLMGMFSMIDVLIGRPIEEILEKMSLSQEVKGALLGKDNSHARLLHMICSYERAQWKEVTALAEEMSLHIFRVVEVYRQAVEWADGIFGISLPKK